MSLDNILLTDEDPEGKLKNFCYKQCDNESNHELQNCRGLIYKDDKPFLKSFGYTPCYTLNTIPIEIKNNLSNYRFFESYEGTLLRLFYNDINNKWYLSTHRRLDATKSYWGSKDTFGNRFNKIIKQEDYDKLDKNLHYMFLITPSEEYRIVCTENLDSIFHIGTYDSNFNFSYEYDIGVKKPNEFILHSYEELEKCVNSADYKYIQGIIINDPTNNRNYKIINDNYKIYSDLRSNTPSIKFRYLEIRTDQDKKQLFCDLYPKFYNEFSKYEEYLLQSCKNIFQTYIKRYIKKQFANISQEEYKIVKECHDWHLLDKENNKISLQKIIQLMNLQPAVHLNRIIKIYKHK